MTIRSIVLVILEIYTIVKSADDKTTPISPMSGKDNQTPTPTPTGQQRKVMTPGAPKE